MTDTHPPRAALARGVWPAVRKWLADVDMPELSASPAGFSTIRTAFDDLADSLAGWVDTNSPEDMAAADACLAELLMAWKRGAVRPGYEPLVPGGGYDPSRGAARYAAKNRAGAPRRP